MYTKFKIIWDSLIGKAFKIVNKFYLPRFLVFIMDNVAVFLTFLFSYLLRFNFLVSEFSISLAIQQAIIAVAVYAIFALILRSHSGLIRHTTIIDISNVFVCTSSSLVTLVGITLFARKIGWLEILNIPLSILLIHYVSINVALFSVRIAIKLFFLFITGFATEKKKVLIFGAGAMGIIVKRVIQSDIKGSYQIAGFLDNNKKLQGKNLNGIPVYSPKILSSHFLHKNKIESLIFAIRDISAEEKSMILRSALNMGLNILETPPVDTWLNGQFKIQQLQKIKLENLLGREPIQLNMTRIGIGLTNRKILVTGAAGSIGSEIVRQLTRFNIKNLILVDQAETPLFYLENELKSTFDELKIKVLLADITHKTKMDQIFHEYRPEVVFHAAAYKHVPLMEDNPHEAIRINVGGTKVITMLAAKYLVKKFVMISTDKAVNPTNIMGASKRICEIIVQLFAQKSISQTQYIITRFGNVLGSNGSVIPTFSKQIEEGGPVTVTHPEITRYFMTIPEACQLVLEAGFMGKGGEIFVFDMGKPVKIADLARQMIQLSGLTPEKDIKIVYTGLRPGEKLYEELLADQEFTKPTHHPKIKIANVIKITNMEMVDEIDNLLKDLYKYSKKQIVEYCKKVVPEYESNKKDDLEQPRNTMLFESPQHFNKIDIKQ